MTEEKQPTELEALQQKAEEYLAGWKRARADYQNFKKETEKNRVEMIQFANASLIAELIPIYNHYKLACEHVPEDMQDKDWVKGFVHIKNQLTEFFDQLGIEEIKTIGEKFNPDIHEALEHVEHKGTKPNYIFEQISPGYTLHGKLLQPARVKVAK